MSPRAALMAAELRMAIEARAAHAVDDRVRNLCEALGGQPSLLATMTPAAQNLYLLSLVLTQS